MSVNPEQLRRILMDILEDELDERVEVLLKKELRRHATEAMAIAARYPDDDAARNAALTAYFTNWITE